MIDFPDEYFVTFARDIVVRASSEATSRFRHASGWLKDNRSLVTEADIKIQRALRDEIRNNFPEHGFLGEEKLKGDKVFTGEEEWIWIVDPVDGTDSFASGLPVWGVSVALLHNGEPVMGVFYMPILEELYHATRDGEAMLTLKPGQEAEENIVIHVDSNPELHRRSLFLVPSTFHRSFTSDFQGKQRTLGSIAAHMCVLARGGGVASIMKAKVWDLAASLFILQKAGGVVLDIETGKPAELKNYLEDPQMPWVISASSKEVYSRIKNCITSR